MQDDAVDSEDDNVDPAGTSVARAKWVPDNQPRCVYGLQCTRSNPKHFREESHPATHSKVKEYRIGATEDVNGAAGAASRDGSVGGAAGAGMLPAGKHMCPGGASMLRGGERREGRAAQGGRYRRPPPNGGQ
jgi:hypothetical protein